jgi:preprotein translocase subunit Sec63
MKRLIDIAILLSQCYFRFTKLLLSLLKHLTILSIKFQRKIKHNLIVQSKDLQTMECPKDKKLSKAKNRHRKIVLKNRLITQFKGLQIMEYLSSKMSTKLDRCTNCLLIPIKMLIERPPPRRQPLLHRQ